MFGFRFELDVTGRRFALSIEALNSTESESEQDGIKGHVYLIA